MVGLDADLANKATFAQIDFPPTLESRLLITLWCPTDLEANDFDLQLQAVAPFGMGGSETTKLFLVFWCRHQKGCCFELEAFCGDLSWILTYAPRIKKFGPNVEHKFSW